MNRFAALAAALLVFSGCAELNLLKGRALERDGAFSQAIAEYERFLKSRPRDPRFPGLLFKVGDLYQNKIGLCRKAKPYYEHLVRSFPKETALVARARAAIFSCPNFFPIDDGLRWIYVDSITGGRALRRVIDATENPKNGDSSLIDRYYQADGELYGAFRRDYRRTGYYLQETVFDAEGRPSAPSLILRFPYQEGLAWETRRGNNLVHYRIESTRAAAEVRAGRFSDCLKVREEIAERQFVAFRYFAPDVGLVLQTLWDPEQRVEVRDFELAHRRRILRSREKPAPELSRCVRYLGLDPESSWTYVDPAADPDAASTERVVRLDPVTGEHLLIDRLLGEEGSLEDLDTRIVRFKSLSIESEPFTPSSVRSLPTVLLEAPCRPGQEWKTRRDGSEVRFKILRDDVRVRVRAGRFKKVLKIEERTTGSEVVRLHYYAPQTGLVLTSLRKGNTRRRAFELARFSSGDTPEVLPEELQFSTAAATAIAAVKP